MAIDSPNSAAQLEQRVAQLVRLLGTHARRRLVEQQHVGVGGQHGGDLDPLERAVGQPGDLGVEQVAQAEHLGQRLGPARSWRSLASDRRLPSMPATVAVVGLEVLGGHQVLAHGRALDQADVLERAPETEAVRSCTGEAGDVAPR